MTRVRRRPRCSTPGSCSTSSLRLSSFSLKLRSQPCALEEYLDKMMKPSDYRGPKLVTVLRDTQAEAKTVYLEYTEKALGSTKLKGPIGTFA